MMIVRDAVGLLLVYWIMSRWLGYPLDVASYGTGVLCGACAGSYWARLRR